ncbi:hypothetical protein ACFVTF_27165 [Kitasatospora sp. NPDC057940]|uniref:hypothetical protein n=1 Tax=Kitasatospora sp. NPDC057940 TaxID=3346285 RepID=UPI0036DB70DC
MTADLLPGGVVLDRNETDIVERALFIAIHHRLPPEDADPSVDACRALFDELRRVRRTETSPAPDPHRPAVGTVRALRAGRVDRVLFSETAWSTARSALLLACFDDTLCEHDFQTIVGWRRSDFHALAAECEGMDSESLRAELFRARSLEDGVRHGKLLTFAVDHMGMEPSRRDVEAVERTLSALASACDREVLADLVARTRAMAAKAGRRTRRAEFGRRGQRAVR